MLEYLHYVLGGAVAVILVAVTLTVRHFLEIRRKRMAERLYETDDEGAPLLGGAMRKPLATDFLVQSTGLELTGAQALGWIVLGAVLLGSGMFLVRFEWWMGLIGLGLGGLIVFFSFYYFKARYRNQIQAQLPDMFYLLARSLRAGLSLDQSLHLVATQGLQPLAGEFRRCTSQIRLGLPITAALENMGKRLELLDFNAFVSAIGLFQTTGGNLPLVLDRLAGTTRDRVQFRAYFRSATALGRISSYAIAVAAPLIFMTYAFIDPDYVSIFFSTKLGILLFAIAVVLEIVGILWIRLLLKAEL
jgi:tight adherence protein B